MKRRKTIVKRGNRIKLRHRALDVDGGRVNAALLIGELYDIFTTATNKGKKYIK